MKSVFLYFRSILEIAFGAFLGLGLVGAAIKAAVGIVLLARYWSARNLGTTIGDALAALIVFLLARALIRDGLRVWSRARVSAA